MRRRMRRSQGLFRVTAGKDGRRFLISGFGPPLRNGGAGFAERGSRRRFGESRDGNGDLAKRSSESDKV